MILPRTLEASIQKAGSQFPVLLMTGARHVGKTTLAPSKHAGMTP